MILCFAKTVLNAEYKNLMFLKQKVSAKSAVLGAGLYHGCFFFILHFFCIAFHAVIGTNRPSLDMIYNDMNERNIFYGLKCQSLPVS